VAVRLAFGILITAAEVVNIGSGIVQSSLTGHPMSLRQIPFLLASYLMLAGSRVKS
jgi:hypothetical protein